MDCCSLMSGLKERGYFLAKQMGLRNADFDYKRQKFWQRVNYHLQNKTLK